MQFLLPFRRDNAHPVKLVFFTEIRALMGFQKAYPKRDWNREDCIFLNGLQWKYSILQPKPLFVHKD